jgi:hypothetical protein
MKTNPRPSPTARLFLSTAQHQAGMPTMSDHAPDCQRRTWWKLVCEEIPEPEGNAPASETNSGTPRGESRVWFSAVLRDDVAEILLF